MASYTSQMTEMSMQDDSFGGVSDREISSMPVPRTTMNVKMNAPAPPKKPVAFVQSVVVAKKPVSRKSATPIFAEPPPLEEVPEVMAPKVVAEVTTKKPVKKTKVVEAEHVEVEQPSAVVAEPVKHMKEYIDLKVGSVAYYKNEVMKKKKECHDAGDKDGEKKYTLGSKYVGKAQLMGILGMEVKAKRAKKEKDPDMPKRNLSAYMLFSNLTRKNLKEASTEKITMMPKKISMMWKNLAMTQEMWTTAESFSEIHLGKKQAKSYSDYKKKYYAEELKLKQQLTKEEEAARTRYKEEMAVYKGEQDAHKAPKRPQTAFFLFRGDMLQDLKSKKPQYPLDSITTFSKKCGVMWKALAMDEKKWGELEMNRATFVAVPGNEKKTLKKDSYDEYKKKYYDEELKKKKQYESRANELKEKYEVAYKQWIVDENLEDQVNPKTGRVTKKRDVAKVEKEKKPKEIPLTEQDDIIEKSISVMFEY